MLTRWEIFDLMFFICKRESVQWRQKGMMNIWLYELYSLISSVGLFCCFLSKAWGCFCVFICTEVVVYIDDKSFFKISVNVRQTEWLEPRSVRRRGLQGRCHITEYYGELQKGTFGIRSFYTLNIRASYEDILHSEIYIRYVIVFFYFWLTVYSISSHTKLFVNYIKAIFDNKLLILLGNKASSRFP